MTAKTGAREDGGWRRNAAQVREWSRPARKKDCPGGKSWGWRRSWVRAGWVWGGGGGQLCGAAAEDGDPWTPHWARCLAQKWDSGRNDRRNGSAPAPWPCHSRASCPAQSRSAADETRVWAHPIPIPPPHPSPFPLPLIQVPLDLSSLHHPPPVQHPAICSRVDVSIGLGLDNYLDTWRLGNQPSAQ